MPSPRPNVLYSTQTAGGGERAPGWVLMERTEERKGKERKGKERKGKERSVSPSVSFKI